MTDFLFDAGTNGFVATPFNLLTTELNTLGIGLVALSSVGGTSGVFTQANFADAIWAYIQFKVGTGGVTPLAGANLSGWWVNSMDGGSTFEKASAAIPRSPDFIIPLNAAAYSAADLVFATGLVRLPAPSCKVLLQNNSGVALPSASNVLTVGPVAVKY